MKTFYRNCFFCLVCLISNVVHAQLEKVAETMKLLNKGLNPPLMFQDYINGLEDAIAFLERIDSLQSAEYRMKVVCFAAKLYYQSKANRQDAGKVDAFVSLMVSLMQGDTSSQVRSEAARRLREVVPPELIDRHHSSILNAYKTHKNWEILFLYASLPSCQSETVVNLARSHKIESTMGTYGISAILARFGDKRATDELIANAESIVEPGDMRLSALLDALAFARSDKIKRFLVKGLRTEDYITLADGSRIPQRNCHAKALCIMNQFVEEFPVKNKYDFFTAHDLDRIEQWCAVKLGMSVPSAPHKEMLVVPSFHLEEK
ncbi:MAG: hypothetical protein IJJ26_05500 [Victivallales bacterium]|nr:hypothetical protein [Victivallales bacterium]